MSYLAESLEMKCYISLHVETRVMLFQAIVQN